MAPAYNRGLKARSIFGHSGAGFQPFGFCHHISPGPAAQAAIRCALGAHRQKMNFFETFDPHFALVIEDKTQFPILKFVIASREWVQLRMRRTKKK
jgi:hypothetical protein